MSLLGASLWRLGLVLALLFLVGAFTVLSVSAQRKSDIVWQDRIAVASGEARKGPWRMNRSQFLYVDDPTVALGDQGHVGVAWADNARLDIFFQLYGPDGKTRLGKPVNVSQSPGTFSWLPRMVVATDDVREIFLLWQEIVFSGGSHGGEIFFARSTDGGKSFSRPTNMSNSRAGDGKGRLTERYWDNGSLDLIMEPSGSLYAAWTEYDGKLWFSRSSDRGETFSAALHVSGDEQVPARGPSLAAAAGGTVHLAWTVGERKAADIRVASSTDGGRSFGEPRIAVESDGHADAPKIAVDGDGTLHLVYAESPTGPFGRYHVRYARLAAGKRVFGDSTVLAASGAQEAASVAYPSLSLDAAGALYVIWEMLPKPRHYSRGLGMTISHDGGKTFSPPTTVPGTVDASLGISGSQQGLLMRKLAVNRNGAIAVVNSTYKTGEGSHIWLIRGTPVGR